MESLERTLEQNDPKEAKRYFERKLSFTTGPAEVKHLIERGLAPVLIDVREPKDFDTGHVPGAINLPESRWNTLDGLSNDQQNILYCYSVVCHLAAKAAVYFASEGFSVMEMDGGIEAWRDSGYELETATRQKRSA